ncbi:PREDICTED: dnaJ homolog subfamily C member 30 [Vollenhovia emeryi]|uniref:dnaJ homolog subfamily C member 30 n=1 Tax=Vollenhovia emeryi TaxID=411798 RepID=UPI0005F528C9|nr:PREDICTED: dnaJ homolog subfamily C member 30 [Vollenhovia emeryi]
MHAALARSPFKSNVLHCTKSTQLVRLYSTRQGAKSNHYDTLNITPHATQTEVKSAYYKLTLQYHPDKNKSEYAKKKFQAISEAYEVLGSHEQRKIYDRTMLLHRQPSVSATAEQPVSRYSDKVYSGSSKIYNFDAWTQAHYGKQIRDRRKRRDLYEHAKNLEENWSHSNSNKYTEIAIFLLTLTMIAMIFREKPDTPRSARRNSESKDGKT